MAKLEKIWIERNQSPYDAIRIDWDNDRHQRIGIEGRKPIQMVEALKRAVIQLEEEIYKEKI